MENVKYFVYGLYIYQLYIIKREFLYIIYWLGIIKVQSQYIFKEQTHKDSITKIILNGKSIFQFYQTF